MKLLCIFRKYPPFIGGLETFGYNLIKNIKEQNRETYEIINKKGNKNLPFFFIYSLIKALYLIKTKEIDVIYLADGILSPIGAILKRLTNKKVVITIHGKEVTYNNKLYQKVISKLINMSNLIICVSKKTQEEAIKIGVAQSKISVINNGVNQKEFVLDKPKTLSRNEISNKIGIKLSNKKILLTNGRLIRRKGVRWFVEEVIPNLRENVVYIISGDGPERKEIEKSIVNNNLEEKVFLLGSISQDDLKLLYNSADLFIMPNIHINGDLEGFGIVAIEASSCGLQVIASRVDGIPDAVLNGKTGWLVEEKDTNSFIKRINRKPIKSDIIIKETKKNFDWEIVTNKYLYLIEKMLKIKN